MFNEAHQVESFADFAVRVQSERDALEARIIDEGLDGATANTQRALFAEWHEAEKEYKDKFETLADFVAFKEAMNYSSTPRAVTPDTEPLQGNQGELSVPRTQEPTEAVLAVSQEITSGTNEIAPNSVLENIRQSFAAILEMEERKKRAENDLRGNDTWNGLVKGLKNLRLRMKTLLDVDESKLSTEDLAQHQKVKSALEKDITNMSEREWDAQDFVARANHDIGQNIQWVVEHFSSLPKELRLAIGEIGKAGTTNDDIFKKYDLSPDAAMLVSQVVNKGVDEKLEKLNAKLERLPSVAGTPELANYNRTEIETVLIEKGISTENIGEGIKELMRMHAEETIIRKAQEDAAYLERIRTSESLIEQARFARGNVVAKTENLSGNYHIGKDGEVYNVKSGARVDTSGNADTGVVPPSDVPPTSPRVIRAENGKITEGSLSDPERILEDEAFDRIFNAPPLRAKQYPPLSVTPNPALGGVYSIEEDGSVRAQNGTTVVEQSIPELENEPVTAQSKFPVRQPRIKGDVIENFSAIDEIASPEMINVWAKEGITIKPGTPIAKALSTVQKVRAARAMEDIAATEARVAKKSENFPDVQKTYFDASRELIRRLGEASQQGDNDLVKQLEESRTQLEAEYAKKVAEYLAQNEQAAAVGNTPVLEAVDEALEFANEVQLPQNPQTPSTSSYDSAMEEQWNTRALGIEAPDWTMSEAEVRTPQKDEESYPVLKDENNPAAFDELIALWASEDGLPGAESLDQTSLDEAERKAKELEGLVYLSVDIDLSLLESESAPTSVPSKAELFGAFNAEVELAKIMHAPKAERRILLESYKEQLALQKIGIGNAQKTLIELVRKNPEMSNDDFVPQFRELTKDFHPTIAHFTVAENAFRKFKEKHNAVEEYSRLYPDPSALFMACFGEQPVGKVEIIKGPMTLYFRCHDENDYIRLYKGAGNSFVTMSQSDLARAKGSGGCAGVTTLIPELNGVVIAENAGGRVFEGYAKRTYEHEEQHAMNATLQTNQEAYFSHKKNNALTLEAALSAREEFDTLHGGGSEKEREKAQYMFTKELERIALYDARVLRATRSVIAEKRAADEILAFTKDGRKPKEIFDILTQKEQEGGLYDYLEDKKIKGVVIPTGEDFLNAVNTTQPGEFIKILNDQFAKTKDEVFGQEYRDVIQGGIDAYMQLSEHGLAEEAIRSVFQHEPLIRWSKVAGRIMDGSPKEVELNLEVVVKFEAKFGIDGASLRQIEGFGNLSAGQQLLVLKNLEQLTLSDITKQSKEKQKEEWGNTKWWRKGLQMIGSIGMKPELRIAELEKELLVSVRDPRERERIATTMGYIEELSKVAAQGPEVEEVDGAIRINYVSPKDVFTSLDDKHLSAESFGAVEAFNQTASDFAQIPHEWRYGAPESGGAIVRAANDVAGVVGLERRDSMKSNRALYEKSKYSYDKARAKLLDVYVKKFTESGETKPEERAMLAMNKHDEQVALNQLFNAHPDAETALQSIADQSVLRRGFKEFWKAKGNFIAYGALGRAATVSAASALAIPTMGASLIAAGAVAGAGFVVGSKIGAVEASRLIKERRSGGRLSEEDEREDVEYQAPWRNSQGETEEDAKGVVFMETKTRKIKEYTDATFFIDRIERLTDKLDVAADRSERALLEKKIAQTTALMSAKFEAGMINFGGSSLDENDERRGATIANKLSFMQAMSRGAIESTVDRAALEKLAEDLVGLRGARIGELRTKEIKDAARTAGFVRAGLGLVGAFLAQQLMENVPIRHTVSKLYANLISSLNAGGKPDIAQEIVQPSKAAIKEIDLNTKKIVSPTPTPPAVQQNPPAEVGGTRVIPPRAAAAASVPQGYTLQNPTRQIPPVDATTPKAATEGVRPKTFLKPNVHSQNGDWAIRHRSEGYDPRVKSPENSSTERISSTREVSSRNVQIDEKAEAMIRNEVIRSVRAIETSVGRPLSGGELTAIKNLATLESKTTDATKLALVHSAKQELISAMKNNNGALTGDAISVIVKKVL